ncbi:5'-nucleotidase C-terminal domain-containing protein [Pollutimonas sp. H1-120]|uniref:bifunctional metallophosphatase/5'-nucleotidase n=1 Tax=Pollutimonas sp. H1-120 TaxID=3148824 RepID=UPI003B5290DC
MAGTLSVTAMLAACGHAQPDPITQSHDRKNLSITLLHINDHHSHLDEESITLSLKTAADTREKIRVPLGGFARVSAAMRELGLSKPNAIKIHAGDALTGDLYFSLTGGKADADMMNTVCFDTLTLGNHEFDAGDAGLKKFLDFLSAGDCRTAVLGANVRFGANSPLNPAIAPAYVAPSAIVEREGRKIGFIGITIADKTKRSSRPDADTEFLDEAITAQAEIDKLIAQGINKIVLQTHQGYQADLRLASRLSGVDAIVGGDSHSLLGPASLARYGLTPEGPYPTLGKSADGKPVCIAQAGHYSHVVGELRLEFDEAGDLARCSGMPHILLGNTLSRNDPKTLPLTEAEYDAIRTDIGRAGVFRPTRPDDAAAAVLAPHKAAKDAFGSSIVATSASVLCSRRIPGTEYGNSQSPQGAQCNDDAHTASHGGDIQQIVAESLLRQGKAFFDADLSIQNGGGVRIDVPEGPITVKDVYSIMPFSNTLVLLRATGAQIKAALEDAMAAVLSLRPATGAYPYAAGLRWTLDARRPKGQRFLNMEVRTAHGRYIPFDMNKIYNVATTNFLADGQDHYTAFKRIKHEHRLDVELDQAEALLEYLQHFTAMGKQLKRLPTEHYSTQAFIGRR